MSACTWRQRNWMELLRPLCAIVSYVVGMALTRIAVEIAGRAGLRRIASFTLAHRGPAAGRLRARHSGDAPGTDCRSAIRRLLQRWWHCWRSPWAVQTATLTHIGALTVYTTFVTGTLTKLTESFTRALFWAYDHVRELGACRTLSGTPSASRMCRKGRCWPRPGSATCIGAAVGTALKLSWELRALYVPVAILLGFVVLDLFRPIDVEEEQRQTGQTRG